MRRHRTAGAGLVGQPRPGYDVLAAALSPELELEVEETGEFFVHSRCPLATD